MSLKQRILTLKKILITCHVTAFMTLWETEAGQKNREDIEVQALEIIIHDKKK